MQMPAKYHGRPVARTKEHFMATTLSQSIRPQFRTIEGLAIRFAESEPRPDDALLLNPWPERPLRLRADLGRASRSTRVWWRSTCRASGTRAPGR